MKLGFILLVTLSLPPLMGLAADELPFDRTRINRYSLDGLVRSIALRQGERIWFGYDLEQAKPFKVWRAPGARGDSGLKRGYTTKSVGTALFEDKSEEGWKLALGDREQTLKVRYLGCTQGKGYFEFRWELRHDSRRLNLRERVPIDVDKIVRELRVDGLKAGEALQLSPDAGKAWKTTDGKATTALSGNQWTRLELP